MNSQNICSMIDDLLPLYIDNLTSDTTNDIIENHLLTCSSCKQKYEILKTQIDIEVNPLTKIDKKEIHYLKKFKSYQNISITLGAIISFLFGAALPPAYLVISFIPDGEIPDYFLARLQVQWLNGLLSMFKYGVIVCACYLLFMIIIKKIIRHKL